jgi:hypothetical protein
MKSVAIHAVLALFGLTFAYQTWTRPAEEEQPLSTEAVILDCPESKFGSLEIETQSHLVSFQPKAATPNTEYWVTTRRKKPEEEKQPKDDPAQTGADEAAKAEGEQAEAGAKAQDKAAASEEPAKPAEPEKKLARPYDPDAPVVFLANQKFRELLKSITPLRALRGLGEVPKDKEASFGLDEPTTFLRVTCGGKQIALDIGGRTYGSGDRYARVAKGKETYLLDGRMLGDLQSAQYKFMQGELHEFALSDVDEAVVSALGKQRKLLHRNRQVKEEARWVDAAAPDKRNELFGNWFERVARLKARAYLSEGAEPGADLQIEAQGVRPVLTLEYKLEGKPKDKLEIVRVDTEQGNFYYARSGTTKRWVTLFDSLAKQVDEDVPMVVGAEEPPAEASSAPAARPAPPAALPVGHPPVPGDPHADPHGGPAHGAHP